MSAELKPLSDHAFRRSINERVKGEVQADPDLRRRYWRTLKRKVWIGVFASPFMLLGLWSAYQVIVHLIRSSGHLYPINLFATNAAGLFISLTLLAFSWRLLCGAQIMGTMPRLPMSDREIYMRAWRRFSRAMFFLPLGIWLGLYGYLAWYGRHVGDAGIWVIVCALSQAFLCLGVCSVLASFIYLGGSKFAQSHWLWVLGIVWAMQIVISADGTREFHREPFLLELDAMLPTHWTTEAFAAFMYHGVGDLYPVIMLGVAGLVLYGLASELHRRWHPLYDVAKYTMSETCQPRELKQDKATKGIEGWTLAQEHKSFWRSAGFIERIIRAVLKPREQLVMESLSTVRMAHTRIWCWTLLAGAAAGLLSMLMKKMGWTPWCYVMFVPCAMAGFVSLFSTTFRPFMMAQEQRRADQNPFPLLPEGGEEVFFASLKVELVKWAMVLPHAVIAGLFAWVVIEFNSVATLVTSVAMIWMVVGAMLSSSSMIPIMRQSDVYNFYLFRGWLAAFTQVLLICGPVLTVVILGFRWNFLFWLAIPAALGSTVISCQFSLWQWRMGTYDFIGNPVVSGGMGGLMPNQLQNKAVID